MSQNEHMIAYWDVPLYADTMQVKANRINITILDKIIIKKGIARHQIELPMVGKQVKRY